MTDVLSPLASKILSANPRAYEALTITSGAPALAHDLLDGVKPDQLFSVPVAAPSFARTALAALWLWHDGLHECHKIVQDIPDSTGSFWHAIMHRREGDFSNSKYWYARVGGHPALTAMAEKAGAILQPQSARREFSRLLTGGWNTGEFVDLVEIRNDNPADDILPMVVQLQQLEWKLLFDECVRRQAASA